MNQATQTQTKAKATPLTLENVSAVLEEAEAQVAELERLEAACALPATLGTTAQTITDLLNMTVKLAVSMTKLNNEVKTLREFIDDQERSDTVRSFIALRSRMLSIPQAEAWTRALSDARFIRNHINQLDTTEQEHVSFDQPQPSEESNGKAQTETVDKGASD
jgi:hypothetical protein